MTWECLHCGHKVENLPPDTLVATIVAGHVCPASPLTELAASAVVTHELYVSLKDAGFEPTEALYLVAQMMIGKR